MNDLKNITNMTNLDLMAIAKTLVREHDLP